MKNRTEKLAGKLKLSEVPKRPWSHLMVDFIIKLPVVAGKDAILVVCNRLSKMTHFVATTKETSAEGISKAVPRQCVETTQVARKCGVG